LARMLTLAALLLLTAPLNAQDHPDPPARPAPRPISPSAAPPRPADDSIPGLEDADFRITPAPLRREGSFITRQRASVVRLPSGDKAAVFHKDAQGRAERPMVLLPCLTLQGMEQTIANRDEETAFLLTGQVFAYRGVNYLLPTAAPTASVSDAPKQEAVQPATPPAQPDKPAVKPTDKPADLGVQELIRDLEAQRDRPRTLGEAPQPAPPPTPAASPSDLLAEGTNISLRRGRIVRLSRGDWAFAFDNAPTGEAASDRALILNPCLNLQRLESWAAQLGDGASLVMSGRIYQYQGRNHIIPTMYQVTGVGGSGELSPRQ
jgi:hypothetical protein